MTQSWHSLVVVPCLRADRDPSACSPGASLARRGVAVREEWLDAPATWVPEPGRCHRDLLGRLILTLDLRGNLVSDAALAALCLEHGLQMVRAGSDFARFTEVDWLNPVSR